MEDLKKQVNRIYEDNKNQKENQIIILDILNFIKESELIGKNKNQYKKTISLLNEKFSKIGIIKKIDYSKYQYDNSGDIILYILKDNKENEKLEIRIDVIEERWTNEYIEEKIGFNNNPIKLLKKEEIEEDLIKLFKTIEQVNKTIEQVKTKIGNVDYKYENLINYKMCKGWRFN